MSVEILSTYIYLITEKHFRRFSVSDKKINNKFNFTIKKKIISTFFWKDQGKPWGNIYDIKIKKIVNN